MNNGMEEAHGRGETVAELVAEFLDRDQPSAPDAWLGRLAGPEERALFLELVDGARVATRLLPRVLAPGALLCERYRVVRRHAEGGQGGVFVAEDTMLGRQVALKVLAPHTQGDPQHEALFAKESRTLAALNHPNIVAVHELAHDNGLALLVMDLIDGASLAEVIERARDEISRGALKDGKLLELAIGRVAPAGRASLLDSDSWWRSVARVMSEIARTLESAHAAGVIHRDLKPANVMLRGGGLPVVLDFGLAGHQTLQAGAVTQGLHGSIPYLAPEQTQSETMGTDARSDVYQLGLILYELLTLRRAFPGSAVGEVLERIGHGDFAAPRAIEPDVPRELEAICLAACELDPARRYACARALAEDLERWLAGVPTIAERAGWTRRALQRSQLVARRHPWHTAGLLALLAIGIVVPILPSRETTMRSGFYRFEPEDGEFTALPPKGGEVRAGDFLGLHVESDEPRFYYALSVFGNGPEERLFAPWKAVLPSHLNRSKDPREPWGLSVPAGKSNVLCVQVAKQGAAAMEGLLVLESDVARPEIEDWFARLDAATISTQKERGHGLDRGTALRLFEGALSPTRGVRERYAAEWTEAERSAIRAVLASGKAPEDGRLFDLPGVEEHALECRFAGD